MMSRNKLILVKISLVILMTPLWGCALFSNLFSKDQADHEDPIVREALRIRDGNGSYYNGNEEAERSWNEQRERREEEIQYGLDSREIVLGMNMEQVSSIWGRPMNIETAGDPGFGHQRWVYHEGISSRWNIKSSRIVYFESGKVVGWETVN
jgi:hypothetical protein